MKNNMMAEQLIRAALARFEADRQESIAVIELYLNNPAGVAEHPSIVNEIATAITRLSDSEEAISAIERNFLSTTGPQEDE
jgi:7,8-dihydro-6-hydroxymethylpterin-pyrophosphokinase